MKISHFRWTIAAAPKRPAEAMLCNGKIQVLLQFSTFGTFGKFFTAGKSGNVFLVGRVGFELEVLSRL
jgi:hypothetical protein